MSFGILFLIVVCGLVGRLLAGARLFSMPLILGEIAAGVLVGRTGLNLLPTSNPTLSFLSLVGLAMLEFLVGTRLPLRSPSLRTDIKSGLWATALAFAFAVPVALVFANLTHIGHWPMFAVLFAASSAAIVMPIVLERKLDGRPAVVRTITWVAIADTLTVVVLSVVLSTGETLEVLIGSLLVVGVAAAAFLLLRFFDSTETGHRYRKLSKERGWALDLQMDLLLLFGLTWLASAFGTSVLIAGFAAGAVVALLDMPNRLSKQLVGLGQGFFVPLFFVDLGARLDFRGLLSSPSAILLAVSICVVAVLLHVVVARIVRLPIGSGLMASAQSGVPAAVASLGMANHILTPAQGAAVVSAMLLLLVACSVGANKLASAEQAAKERGPGNA